MKGEITIAQKISTKLVDKACEMTVGEMLTELSAIQNAFVWRLTKQGRIRGYLKNDVEKRVFDPVAAVIYRRSGRFFPEGHWTEATAAVGLSPSVCAEIIVASDYEWDSSCRQGALRHKVLGALELLRNAEATASSFTDVFFRGLRRRSATTH